MEVIGFISAPGPLELIVILVVALTTSDFHDYPVIHPVQAEGAPTSLQVKATIPTAFFGAK